MTATITQPTVLKIDQETKDRVNRLAGARHRTPQWVMREAITQYVDREEKRDGFRRDAMEAWVDYQETGLHVTGDEAVHWLASWGDDHEKPVPVCHI